MFSDNNFFELKNPATMSLNELKEQVVTELKDSLETIKYNGRICSPAVINIIVKWGIKQTDLQHLIDCITEAIEKYSNFFTEVDRQNYIKHCETEYRFLAKIRNTMDYKEKDKALKSGNTSLWDSLEADSEMRRNILHKNGMCRCFRFI